MMFQSFRTLCFLAPLAHLATATSSRGYCLEQQPLFLLQVSVAQSAQHKEKLAVWSGMPKQGKRSSSIHAILGVPVYTDEVESHMPNGSTFLMSRDPSPIHDIKGSREVIMYFDKGITPHQMEKICRDMLKTAKVGGKDAHCEYKGTGLPIIIARMAEAQIKQLGSQNPGDYKGLDFIEYSLKGTEIGEIVEDGDIETAVHEGKQVPGLLMRNDVAQKLVGRRRRRRRRKGKKGKAPPPPPPTPVPPTPTPPTTVPPTTTTTTPSPPTSTPPTPSPPTPTPLTPSPPTPTPPTPSPPTTTTTTTTTKSIVVPWGIDEIEDEEITGEYDVEKKAGWGVHVYVLDSGIRTTHEEFDGRAIPTFDVTKQGACDPTDISCAWDVRGHGTHVAGTVAGETVGIAPRSTVHAVKVIDDNGFTNAGMIMEGLDYVITNTEMPAVVQMSLSIAARSPALERSVDDAIAKGITVVVAAGNDAGNACDYSPAMIEGAITVGATNKQDQMCSFSNSGPCVDIFAPGLNILSIMATDDVDTTIKSGTSMAAPHIAGEAALLLARNPSLSPYQVKEMIHDMARKDVKNVGSDTTAALGSVMTIDLVTPPPETPAPTPAPFVAFQVESGNCAVVNDDQTCITSPNYPDKYESANECKINVKDSYFENHTLQVIDFQTEWFFDVLEVNGQKCSGKGCWMSGITPNSGEYITFSSDVGLNAKGWKICTSGTVTPAPTPPPPTPVPPPAFFCKSTCKKDIKKSFATCRNADCRGCSQCCGSWCFEPADEDTCNWNSCAGCEMCINKEFER